MSRAATLTAVGHGILTVGHHGHPGLIEHTHPCQTDRPAKPVAANADRTDAGATTRPGALDLLLFSFAAGSSWGPAQSWRLATRDAGKPQAPVY